MINRKKMLTEIFAYAMINYKNCGDWGRGFKSGALQYVFRSPLS